MKKINEILKQLPGSWEELKLKDFIKITAVEIVEEDGFDNLFVGQDNSLKVISVLTDIPVDELESMPLKDINRIASRISFITTTPKKTKSKIEWKKLEKVSYDDYVNFLLLSKDTFNNMPSIIRAFAVNDFTEEEINEMSMQEVYSGFFTLQRSVRKSLNGMTRSLGLRLAKQSLMEVWKRLTRRRTSTPTK